MINAVNPISEIAPRAPPAEGAHGPPEAAGGAHAEPTPVPGDVVSLSPQALNGLLQEDLAVAYNAAAPDATVSGALAVSSGLVQQIQTAAQAVSGSAALLDYLVNALGGPHYVAAFMTAQAGATPVEPVKRSAGPGDVGSIG